MALPIWTNVSTERVTNIARVVGATVFVAQTGLQGAVIMGWIDPAKSQGLLELASDKFVATVSFLLAAASTFLPAPQGWRSADKELPPGQTTANTLIVPADVVKDKEGEAK